MKKNIYLDNAATTRLHPDVLKAMMPYFCDEYGNASSAYALGKQAMKAVNMARYQAARLIGAGKDEIFFTSGGSEADNWAIKRFAIKNSHKGKHIITSAVEHHAVLHTCQALEKLGFTITYLSPDKYGCIEAEAVADAIREDTILISIMTANNEVGTIMPIRSIGRIARRNGIAFHTDAVQAYGHIPINVNDSMIDMLSVSAHKLGGPKGAGFLYIRNTADIDSFIDGGSQEMGLRAGTYNVPGIVGLGRAAELAYQNMYRHNQKILRLRNLLIKRTLSEIPDTVLNGHRNNRLPNNANFSFKNIDASALLLMLDSKGICASAGSACATGAINPSHVLLAMGIPYETARGSLRFTLSYENTEEEINYTVDTLKDCVRVLQKNH